MVFINFITLIIKSAITIFFSIENELAFFKHFQLNNHILTFLSHFNTDHYFLLNTYKTLISIKKTMKRITI